MRDGIDVLIVGAGPVGLLLAAELARAGVDAAVIERQPERSVFSKALGVTSRSLEIFEDLGLADAAIDAGLWLRGMAVFDNGVPVQRMEVPATGLPFGVLSLAQSETERLLEGCLRRHGGAVRYGWALDSFTETADGVVARLESVDGARRDLRCRWLVGCDGAHSTVRRGLGLEFEGGQYPQTFVLADLDVEWDLPRGAMYRFNWSGESQAPVSLAAIPVHGAPRRYRLSTTLPQPGGAADGAVAVERTPPGLEQIAAVMAPRLPPGTRLSGLRWSSIYRISHRIVPRYGKGRVFLAGDAAHIHPPVGGQGMNTGLQDAHNLAWKLVLAARGQAAADLLDSYTAERHPVGLDVVEQTSRALNAVMAQRINLPGMRETQLFIGYPDSPIVSGDRPAAGDAPGPGDRAPDAGGLRQPFVAHPRRLAERLGGGRHVLVGAVSGRDARFDALAAMHHLLSAALGDAAAGCAVAAPGETLPEDDRMPVLVDAEGAFAAAYGAKPGMVWLVRPDRHIGWHTAAPSVAALDLHLHRILRAPFP